MLSTIVCIVCNCCDMDSRRGHIGTGSIDINALWENYGCVVHAQPKLFLYALRVATLNKTYGFYCSSPH